jgi:hypothetical protein
VQHPLSGQAAPRPLRLSSGPSCLNPYVGRCPSSGGRLRAQSSPQSEINEAATSRTGSSWVEADRAHDARMGPPLGLPWGRPDATPRELLTPPPFPSLRSDAGLAHDFDVDVD